MKPKKPLNITILCLTLMIALGTGLTKASAKSKIVHDAEYYILEAQNGKKWAADDKAVDKKLAQFRKKNGGMPPNILYILIDDLGFGDMGIPELNAIRGYKTPAMNKFADESMRFARMYTEPSCTPTRVAFMTGRQPYRNGMGDTAVDIAGFGLAGKEVTLAEILSDSGYNTVHIGKWHMGDIMESWPNHQGFDFAAFPIHQQGQLTVFNDDAAAEGIAVGIGKNQYDDRFTLDNWFRPDPAHMVTVVEGKRDEKVREVHMKPGERWTQKKYDEMNERFQQQALDHLRKLAKQNKPFFLQYWPVIPLSNPRHTVEKFTTPNGGTYVESMKQLDGWIGEVLDEVEKLELAENTVVVIMGDNGHFTKYSPGSGFTPMIFRGGKADTTEGGGARGCLCALAWHDRSRFHRKRHRPCNRSLHQPCALRRCIRQNSQGPLDRRRGSVRPDVDWRDPRSPGYGFHLFRKFFKGGGKRAVQAQCPRPR